jgi:hypothetical protein
MPLASDLVPYISDSTASIILAAIASAHWAPDPGEPATELGTLQLRVTELFSDSGPKPGETLTIIADRYGDPVQREHMGFNVWNVLPLEPSNSLAMAIRKAPNGWTALAAQAVAPGDNNLVPALRPAREIDKVQDPTARRRLLDQALRSPQDLLFRYALDAITRRGLVPRSEAAQMIVGALAVESLSKNAKLMLVQQLTRRPIYEDELGSDLVNRLVIGAVAGVLTAETGPEWVVIWTQFLTTTLLPAFSTDPSKDQDIRHTLIHSVPEPARRQVPEKLVTSAQQSPRDPRIPKLLEAWKAALR